MNNMMNLMQMMSQVMNGGKNPQAIIEMMAKNNPNVSALVNQINSSGMSPIEFGKQYCKQNGMDFSQIEKMFNNRGIK